MTGENIAEYANKKSLRRRGRTRRQMCTQVRNTVLTPPATDRYSRGPEPAAAGALGEVPLVDICTQDCCIISSYKDPLLTRVKRREEGLGRLPPAGDRENG